MTLALLRQLGETAAAGGGEVAALARVIQLSVAPVFLLIGVGGVLTMLTGRLARIVDRARVLERELTVLAAGADDTGLRHDLARHARRARLVNAAITLAVLCALLVCAVITVLFVDAFIPVNVAWLVALLFLLALACFITSLALFLRETYLATASLRFGRRE
ncbi:MAG: DUF2721 domain-containing protein [Gemmatimonadales bacterium]|nr:DUF2721 domain-containing protein [Gemmatimonadales bacterium]